MEMISSEFCMGILGWFVGPVAWYLLVLLIEAGSFDEWPRLKKACAMIVFVLGVACFIAAMFFRKEERDTVALAVSGILCLLQSGVMYLKICIKKVEERIHEENFNCEQKIVRLTEFYEKLLGLYAKNERERRNDSYVNEFYRAYVDENILFSMFSKFNHSREPFSRNVFSCEGLMYGFTISKDFHSQFYNLIESFFLKRNRGGAYQLEKDDSCKKIFDHFQQKIRPFIDFDVSRRVTDKFYKYLNLCDRSNFIENAFFPEGFIVITDKYYLMPTDMCFGGELKPCKYEGKNVVNLNVVFHEWVYSSDFGSKLYDLYGFGDVKTKPDPCASQLKEVFIIPSTQSDKLFIRKEMDGSYSCWSIPTHLPSDVELGNLLFDFAGLKYDLDL